MKVLLIYPVPPRACWPRGQFRSYWVPTGLAYLAASLVKAGHDVRIHDRERELIRRRFDWDAADADLRAVLADYRPDMVGLSVVTPSVSETATLCQWAKELVGPDVLTVAGGPHPTALPERMLEDCPALDVVAVGEGEACIAALAARAALEDIPGLAFRRDGRTVVTQAAPPPHDLDALGPIPYELFDLDHYTSANRWLFRWRPLRGINLRTSRGCTNRCRFCAGYLVAGVGVRFHSIEYVMDQVRFFLDRFPLESITFEDETLGADRDRLIALCHALRSEGVDKKVIWQGCLRVDQVDRRLLREMRAAGCRQIEFGFESGSDGRLQALGKGSSTQRNERAIRLAKEERIRVFADIMIGLPGETPADLAATLRFVRRARPEIISVGTLAPLPGTAIYRELDDDARRALKWEDYAYLEQPLANLTAMSDPTLARTIRRTYKYFVRPWLLWQLIRDTPESNQPERRFYARKLALFALRHPWRALRCVI